MNFYVTSFAKFKVANVSRYEEGAPGDEGEVMMIEFSLEGQDYLAPNGGGSDYRQERGSDIPQGGVALFVTCETQAEVTGSGSGSVRAASICPAAGCATSTASPGTSSQAGSSICWEIPTREKAGRAMSAMMEMGKLDINELRRAFDGD